MAKLSDLVRAVASSTREPESAVTGIARVLRENGLIRTGGRGTNAAKMTEDDAASLLLGVCCPGDYTKADVTVRIVGGLLAESGTAVGRGKPFTLENHPELGVIQGQTAHSALSSLLRRYSVELAPEPIFQPVPPRLNFDGQVVPNFGFDRLGQPSKLVGDANPKSIAIEAFRDERGWKIDIPIRTVGGDELCFRFSPLGICRSEKGGEITPDDTGRYFMAGLPPKVAHAAILCVRDLNSAAQEPEFQGNPE